tara:strand:+ start:1456 stop:3060 length:1605 start_codon:yes stop_codon:yes gene_type:complete
MASPDVSKYVDLKVFDEDPVNVLNSILTTGRTLLPNWIPQVGQIETALSEAFAVRSTDLSSTINRLPSATTEVLLQLFGLTRSNGTQATATLTITFTDSDTIARTLPAGTEFLYVDSATNISYIFTLDSAFTLDGSLSGTAAVTAQAIGTAYNVAADGQNLTLLSNAAFFSSATFSASPTGGTDAESDDQYFDRGVNLLGSYTSGSTTPTQLKYYVGQNHAYINRVEVYNKRRYRDRNTLASSYGSHNGAILVAIAGKVDNAASASIELPIPNSNLSTLHTSISDRTPSGLSVDLMSAELAKINVTATVVKKSGETASTVKTNIENALKSYLDPNAWDWSQQYLRRNEIISLIDSASGVDYVDTLTMDGVSVIGTNNVGYLATTGTAASFTVNIANAATSGNYAAGEASIYYVDSSDATNPPVLYQYSNEAFSCSGGAATGVTYTAVANGLTYNDDNNGGVLPASTTAFTPIAGDWAGSTHANITFSATSAITGGSSLSNQFVALSGSGAVSTDLVLPNLGTLVIYGTLSITVT